MAAQVESASTATPPSLLEHVRLLEAGKLHGLLHALHFEGFGIVECS